MLLRRLDIELEVIEAGNCDEALAQLERNGGAELALVDLNLPGTPGLDGVTLLRGAWPEMPVVVMSSDDDLATVLTALDRGAVGFIPKSSTADVMIGALRLVLAKGIYLPPSAFLGGAKSAVGSVSMTDRSVRGEPRVGATAASLGLTPRQADVLRLILVGKSGKLIARELALSAGTVKGHTSAALRALNVTTRTQAVVAAGRIGLRLG